MKYYKCSKCDLNYVTNENEICDVCKNALKTDYFDDDINNVCCECGALLKDDEIEFCEECRRKLGYINEIKQSSCEFYS